MARHREEFWRAVGTFLGLFLHCALGGLSAFLLMWHFAMCLIFLPFWWKDALMPSTPFSEMADALEDLLASL